MGATRGKHADTAIDIGKSLSHLGSSTTRRIRHHISIQFFGATSEVQIDTGNITLTSSIVPEILLQLTEEEVARIVGFSGSGIGCVEVYMFNLTLSLVIETDNRLVQACILERIPPDIAIKGITAGASQTVIEGKLATNGVGAIQDGERRVDEKLRRCFLDQHDGIADSKDGIVSDIAYLENIGIILFQSVLGATIIKRLVSTYEGARLMVTRGVLEVHGILQLTVFISQKGYGNGSLGIIDGV